MPTGNATDLAINGTGWFVVRNPVNGLEFVTRYGAFGIDGSGFLTTSSGLRVQGFADADITTPGDLKVDNGFAIFNTNYLIGFHFATDGKLVVTLADGSQHIRGQVLLQSFQFPEKRARINHQLFWLTPEAEPLALLAAPGSNSLGLIVPSALDQTPEPIRLALLPNAMHAVALAEGVLTTGTMSQSDLGITGPGFFLVRETNSSTLFATRAGLSLVGGDGYLKTYDGLRVQGYSNPDLQLPGDVRIDEFYAPNGSTAALTAYSIATDGLVSVRLNDGTQFIRSQVLLFTFRHPEYLVATNLGRYLGVAAAGPEPVNLQASIHNGSIQQYALELINVTEDQLTLRRTLSFFMQGAIQSTNSPTCLAVNGTGFFQVRNPTNGAIFVTRRGNLHLDANAFLVTEGGLRVQGFSDGSLTNIGDLLVNGEPGRQWTVQATEDFQDWINLKSWTTTSDEAEFSDAEYRLHPRRFYRVLVTTP